MMLSYLSSEEDGSHQEAEKEYVHGEGGDTTGWLARYLTLLSSPLLAGHTVAGLYQSAPGGAAD